MKTLNGIVTSLKMQNTIVVEVERRRPHPLYKKLLKITKKYKADANNMTLSVGDMVTIEKTRPVSKDKHFKVVKIIRSQHEEAKEKQTGKEKTA